MEGLSDKMEVLMANSEASATIVLKNEGHTLGNAMRYMLIKHPETKFAGYTVPHPLIPQMNLRVTTTGSPAIDVTAECAQQLIEMLNHMEEVFDGAYERFKSGQ